MRSPGRVYTRTQILEHVWGYGFDPQTNRVDVCVQRLRKQIDVDVGIDIVVQGDPDLLGQVLGNLTSNAAKFTGREGVIRLELAPNRDGVVPTVSNTGSPIPAADRDRVFDRFYRVDASRSGETDGSGLGLSLAREIARAHGGDLVLVRSDDSETTFALTLPLTRNGRR